MDSRSTIELLVPEPNTSLSFPVYRIVNRIYVGQLFQLVQFFEISRLTFRDNRGALSFPNRRNRSTLLLFVAHPALPWVEIQSTAVERDPFLEVLAVAMSSSVNHSRPVDRFLADCDMRKSFDGLFGIIKSDLKREPVVAPSGLKPNSREQARGLRLEARGNSQTAGKLWCDHQQVSNDHDASN
jgi:hypothetical protein